MSQRFRFLTHGLITAAIIASAVCFAPRLQAQTASGKSKEISATWDSRFVPDDAFAVILASPQELLHNEAFQSFPIELFQVQIKESFGIDPNDVSLVKVVIGLQEDGQPAFGIVIEMTQSFELERLLESLQADVEPVAVGERMAYPVAAGPPGTVLCKVNDKTVVLALPGYLETLLAADKGTGKLPLLVSEAKRESGISIMLAIDTIRPVISEMAAQQARTMPAELLPLAELPELIDTAHTNVKFDNKSGTLKLTMTGIDEDATEQIDRIINDGLADTREWLVNLIGQSMPVRSGAEEMQAAVNAYAERLATQIFDTMSAKRSGMDVTLTVDTEIGIAGGTVIASFLSPVEQMIRSFTRQMDSLNNLRMVMLAMHNYHAAYNRLPGPAIMSQDGKPLLSWRVALLPFLEEQALYEQFRLDEAWDSEHNLPLSKRLPKVYATAGVRLPPGQTVVHAAVGEKIGMRPKDKTGFRDILDGTSNTILLLESTADSAVPWSKPADVEIDMEDPLANFIGSPRKSFGVGYADGSVKRLTDDIDAERFKALLTRAGAEVVQP